MEYLKQAAPRTAGEEEAVRERVADIIRNVRERGDQDGDFAQIWAGKESLCKQWGTGLQFPLGELRAEQEIFTFYQGENWRGALCARKAGPEEIIWISDLHLERRGV